MAKRKALSESTRFEVFKRDRFTCQYCGKMAPDVVLNVDHIDPVSNGGTNEMINLVTSCWGCNSGKSDRLLSDDAVVKRQQAEMQQLADRREQIEFFLRWRNEMVSQEDMLANSVIEACEKAFGVSLEICQASKLTSASMLRFTFQAIDKLKGWNIRFYSPDDLVKKLAQYAKYEKEYTENPALRILEEVLPEVRKSCGGNNKRFGVIVAESKAYLMAGLSGRALLANAKSMSAYELSCWITKEMSQERWS